MRGVFFCKKVENGGGFVKSGTFLNAGCLMYSISIGIFYFTFYLFGVRTHPTHPPAYGPAMLLVGWSVFVGYKADKLIGRLGADSFWPKKPCIR